MSSYNKPPLTLTQQLNILEQTGLKIENRQEAFHHLKFINYHRFLGYCKVFRDDNPKYQKKINEIKLFKVGSTFNQVLSLYHFDRELRLLVMNALERIEVAVRTVIVNTLSLKYGDFWYLDIALFKQE